MWYLVMALIIWASSFVAAKYAYTLFDPVITVQLRLLIAAAMMSPFFIKAYRSIPRYLKKSVWILALVSFPIVLLLQFVGLKYTSASNAVTLVAIEPMIFLLLNHFLFHQKTKIIDWVLCLVTFVGIVLTVVGETQSQSSSLWGSLLLLSAGLAFALSTLYGKDVIAQIDAKNYTAVTLVLGAIWCVPFTLGFNHDWRFLQVTSLNEANVKAILALIYLGVFSSWLAYRLWNKGVTAIPANTTGILIPLEPIFGIFFAMLLLGEQLTLLKAIGSALVIGAVMTSALLPMVLPTFKTQST